MLSRQEQRVWDDVQRFWAEEADEPPRAAPPAPSRRRRPSRDPAGLPAAVVAGVWITILLTLVGALVAALAIGVATALGWALWRVWPQLGRQGAPDTSWNGRKDRTTRGPADKPWHRRPRRLRDSR